MKNAIQFVSRYFGIKIQNIKILLLIKVQPFGHQREKPELLTTKMWVFGESVMLCQALLFLFYNSVLDSSYLWQQLVRSGMCQVQYLYFCY